VTGVASSQTFKLQAAKRLLRLTPSQQVVLDGLNQQPDPLSAQALHQILSSQRPLGLATVYRALEALKLLGLIQWRPSRNGESLYSAIAQDRLHLTCLQCGQSIQLDWDTLQAEQPDPQPAGSFTIFYRTLEFFGLCQSCTSGGSPLRRP
jgi:Fur family ferric uptake transcriptional regulator